MSEPKVLIVESSDGDWEELYLDGDPIFIGHSIPVFAWVVLLKKLGVEVSYQEVDAEEI